MAVFAVEQDVGRGAVLDEAQLARTLDVQEKHVDRVLGIADFQAPAAQGLAVVDGLPAVVFAGTAGIAVNGPDVGRVFGARDLDGGLVVAGEQRVGLDGHPLEILAEHGRVAVQFRQDAPEGDQSLMQLAVGEPGAGTIHGQGALGLPGHVGDGTVHGRGQGGEALNLLAGRGNARGPGRGDRSLGHGRRGAGRGQVLADRSLGRAGAAAKQGQTGQARKDHKDAGVGKYRVTHGPDSSAGNAG